MLVVHVLNRQVVVGGPLFEVRHVRNLLVLFPTGPSRNVRPGVVVGSERDEADFAQR
jgi:hypothetical protein